MQKYDAIILAGGVNSGKLRKYAPYENEAFIIIGSYPMIHYVYRAARASRAVNRIIIAGPVESLKELFKKEENLYFAPAGATAVESFTSALAAVEGEPLTEKVLVMPSDIPFITPEAIDDFVSRCEQVEADVYYSIVSKETNEKRFPGVVRTYARLKEGVFTGGNIFMVRVAVVDRCLEVARKLVANRKSVLASARLFGGRILWRLITRRLTIADVEQRFEEILGIRGRAIISEYPEIGVDVDKPSDLKLAEEYLGANKTSK